MREASGTCALRSVGVVEVRRIEIGPETIRTVGVGVEEHDDHVVVEERSKLVGISILKASSIHVVDRREGVLDSGGIGDVVDGVILSETQTVRVASTSHHERDGEVRVILSDVGVDMGTNHRWIGVDTLGEERVDGGQESGGEVGHLACSGENEQRRGIWYIYVVINKQAGTE